MTPSAVETAIKARLNTQWASLYPSSFVVWEGDPPPVFDEPALHLRAEIRLFEEVILTVTGTPGQNHYAREGDVILRALAPSHAGTETVRAYADAAAKVFRGWMDGDLSFDAVTPGVAFTDGIWIERNELAHFVFALSDGE